MHHIIYIKVGFSWQAAKVGFEAARGGLPSLAVLEDGAKDLRGFKAAKVGFEASRGGLPSLAVRKILCTILYI